MSKGFEDRITWKPGEITFIKKTKRPKVKVKVAPKLKRS